MLSLRIEANFRIRKIMKKTIIHTHTHTPIYLFDIFLLRLKTISDSKYVSNEAEKIKMKKAKNKLKIHEINIELKF